MTVGQAAGLLEWTEHVVQRRRRIRGAAWWPTAVAGVVILLAAPFYLPSHRAPPVSAANSIETLVVNSTPIAHPAAAGAYWLVAVPVWYLVSCLYYRGRAIKTGVKTPILGWCIVGLAAMALDVLLSPAAARVHVFEGEVAWLTNSYLAVRGLGPVMAIVVAIPLLAWAERNRRLALAWCVILATTLTAALYDVSNLLGRFGPDVGTTVNVCLVGVVFLLCASLLRTHGNGHSRLISLP
jgi:hypothetical protein